MSTPEEQLERGSTDDVAEVSDTQSGNGSARGFRARRAAARSARATSDTNGDSNGDITQVSSDVAAPAPPKRRKFGDDTGGPATVSSPAARPTPAPITYSTAHAEASAELRDDSGELDDPYPARRPITAAPAGAYGVRKTRQTVTKVDLWSVTKLSLCFYISTMFVMIVAMISLWLIADAAGIIHSVEKFLGDLLSAKNFKFLSGDVLRGTILVGLVIVALQVVITVIAASFYNIFAELFGGLEIVVKEEDELR
jgi:hypothetical protein